LVSLVGLWGFATYLTVGAGYRLYTQGELITKVAAPAEEILGAIQGERRASMVYLAAPSGPNRDDLNQARAIVDQKVATYRSILSRGDIKSLTPVRVMNLAQAQLNVLDGLDTLRSDVNSRHIGADRLMSAFTDLGDPITPLYTAVSTFPDDQVSADGQALQTLAHARELRARADAILANALATGRFTRETYRQFVQAVGFMRAEYHETYVRMTEQYRREYNAFFSQDLYVSLTHMEDAAVGTGGNGTIPVNAGQWHQANTTALAQLSDFQLHLATFIEKQAKGPAYVIFAQIIVAALIGLIAVIVTVMISLRIARRLAARLRGLSTSAHTLADTQLPTVVDRLRRGEQVDVDAEAPVLSEGEGNLDEIGEVGEAFNTVRRTAISTAVEQAELRVGIRNVFLNIARRSQTLVKKQLSLVDVMERKTVNPEELADLFQMDHLATRMRRYAENLVILGGGRPGRHWDQPVGMQEVLRGAASEAEQYERVRVLPQPDVVLTGSVVFDVVHLVAELIDNATTFSPPHTTVQVFGQMVPHGFAIEVEDRGLGMSETDLHAANGWLTNPPEFNVLALRESPRLGMFVVARLASRHGIQVTLRRSPYGGITAIVLVPPHLVAKAGAAQELHGAETAAAISGQPAEDVRRGAPEDQPPARPVGSTVIGSIVVDDTAVHSPAITEASPPAPLNSVSRPGPVTEFSGVSQPPWPPMSPAADTGSGQTYRGLPRRVRQARLAPGLRHDPDPRAAHPAPPPLARSAEEVRQMMSAYQRGTVRGRQPITDDADRLSTPDMSRSAPAGHADEESR
jgi:signal transduction histidine kinase